jgi:hypothetical protein
MKNVSDSPPPPSPPPHSPSPPPGGSGRGHGPPGGTGHGPAGGPGPGGPLGSSVRGEESSARRGSPEDDVTGGASDSGDLGAGGAATAGASASPVLESRRCVQTSSSGGEAGADVESGYSLAAGDRPWAAQTAYADTPWKVVDAGTAGQMCLDRPFDGGHLVSSCGSIQFGTLGVQFAGAVASPRSVVGPRRETPVDASLLISIRGRSCRDPSRSPIGTPVPRDSGYAVGIPGVPHPFEHSTAQPVEETAGCGTRDLVGARDVAQPAMAMHATPS